MNNVALIIIYNHQYNKNIDIVEKIYSGRFSNIFHLVPFYNGTKENVIAVYESSHYFQGYVSQGFKSYFKEEYTHYFFVADDLVLNPIINETNYSTHLALTSSTSFIPKFINLHRRRRGDFWPIIDYAFSWRINVLGIEAENQLPSYEKALQKFHHFGLTIKPLCFNQIWKVPDSLSGWLRPFISADIFRHSILTFQYLRKKNKLFLLSYPLVGSYSDIFLVSADSIQLFKHYCGVFAATNLFVEVALPTAMVLSAKEIVTEKDLDFRGKALWRKEDYAKLDKYGNSLKHLLADFPRKYLYLHPIKLSKWDTEL